MEEFRYKAFISYRHQSPDQDIAQKLHRDIETFGIPQSLKKSLGIAKMGRVFRDQEELPLSADLGENIHRALEQSEWLICICSPRYLQSKWCMEELRYYLSLGRRDHILTVVAEGEPGDVFPEELRFKEENGRIVEVEPLAADVRASSLQDSLRRLSGEKLRILAPMLGVNFDDLRQRAKQRRNRILAGLAAGVILLLSGFLGYAFHKNTQITAERNDALIAESKWLAQSANEALDGGDRMLSLLLSLEALPQDFKDPERPVTEEALESLRSAIISGQGDSVYQEVTRISIPGLECWRAQDNYLYCFSRKIDGCLATYDLNTGEKTSKDGALEEEPVQCLFTEGLGAYLIYPDRIEDLNGLHVSKFVDKDSYIDRDPYYEWLDEPAYSLYESGDAYLLLQKEKGVFSAYLRNHSAAYRTYETEGIRLSAAASAGEEEIFLLGGYRNIKEGSAPVVLRVKADQMDTKNDNVIFRYTAETYVKGIDVSRDGSLIAGWREGALLFWNAKAEEPALVFDPDRLGDVQFSSVQFSSQDISLCAILCNNSHVYLFDCAKDEILMDIQPGLYQVSDLMWNAEGSALLLTCSDDAARIVSARDGDVLQTLACPFGLKKAAYGHENPLGNSSNDTFILLEGEEELCVFRLTAQEGTVPLMTRLNDKLSVMSTVSDNSYRIRISADGRRIWNYHGDGLHVYDAQTGEVLKVIAGEDTASKLMPTEQYMFSFRNRRDYRVDPAEESIRIYDPETLEAVQKLNVSYPHVSVYVPPSGDPRVTEVNDAVSFSKLFLNEDASLLFAVGTSSTTLPYPCLFAFRTDTWEECWRIGLDWGLTTDRLFDFAADWPGFILLNAYPLPEEGKILCLYTYAEDPELDFEVSRDNARANYSHQLAGATFEENCSRRIAVEIRNAQTGEVLQVYSLPYTAVLFYPEPEHGILIAQDTEYDVHILKAAEGEEIALCEADSRIFDYAVSDTEVKLRYELFGTMESYAPKGHVVSLSGTVTETPADGIGMPAFYDGHYGEDAFTAASDGLYDAETGVALVHWEEGQYHYLDSWEDGRGVLLFAPFKAASTMAVNGDVVILRWADGTRLREIARQMLGGRELSEEQKQQYFLK